MNMRTLQGTAARSVLLTILTFVGTSGIAQEIPEPPTPSAPGMPSAQESAAGATDAQSGQSNEEAEAPPLPNAEQAGFARSDGEILQALKVMSEAEISQAELAMDEASREEVVEAAQQIIDAHSSTIEQIDAVAERTGVSLTESALSAQLVERSEATTDELEGLSGIAFECTYLQQKADDHQFALDTIDRQLLPFAKSFSVRNFLSEAAPRIEQQAVTAREIRATLDTCS